MRKLPDFYSLGKYRVSGFPSVGSYDLVTGQGYTTGDYAKSPWAFACMDIRGTALGQIPWRIVKKDSEGGADDASVVEDSIVGDLLNTWPNYASWSDILRATEIDMLLRGAAFWLKDVNRLARLNPFTMKVERNKKGITGFKQVINVGGQQIEQTFGRDEVIYFREYHPSDDLGVGVAAIDVARNAVLAEYESQRYIKAFFENDAIPGLLIRTEQDVPPQEMTKLATWWKEKFGGAKNHHKVAFVDKGLEAQILSTDLRAMALEEVRDQARRDICTAFRVPMVLVGDLDAANFATAHEARLSLYQETILPRADYYADVINAELVEALDPNIKFEFAVDELPILQEDKDKLATRLSSMLKDKVVSVEYYREQMGIPADAGPTTEQIDAEKTKELEMAQKPGDLGKWQKKATKALRAGKSADVVFDTAEVPEPLRMAIKARLGQARTVAEIESAFTKPYP